MEIKTLTFEQIKDCPKLIFLPDHYREDRTCRCNEVVCENTDCNNLKSNGEIYCHDHLDDLY